MLIALIDQTKTSKSWLLEDSSIICIKKTNDKYELHKGIVRFPHSRSYELIGTNWDRKLSWKKIVKKMFEFTQTELCQLRFLLNKISDIQQQRINYEIYHLYDLVFSCGYDSRITKKNKTPQWQIRGSTADSSSLYFIQEES